MSQRTSKATRARVAAVLAAPVLALTLMAPAASAAAAAPVDTPAACAGTTHVSLLGHEACLTPSSDDASSSDNLLGGLLGAVTGLLGGLLGGLL
jgi:hypothetical protein